MHSIEKIWDTGLSSPHDLDLDRTMEFRRVTSSSRVVGLRWCHDSERHSVASYAVVLPDGTGVAVTSEYSGHASNWLDVVNADGSVRFRPFPPELSARLDHAHAVLELPRWDSSSGVLSFGIQAGYRVKLSAESSCSGASVGVFLEIDWHTGNLNNWRVQQSGT